MTTDAHAEPVSGRPAPARPRRSGLRRSFDRWWVAYVMLAPVAVAMLFLVGYPLVKGILLSFTNADRYTIGNVNVPSRYSYIGIDNYVNILQSQEFRTVFGWTLIWTFVNVLFHFTFGLGLAVMLNRAMRARGLYRVLLVVPWAVPSFISVFAWRYLFNSPYGFFAQVLTKLGMDNPPAWLSDPFWAKVAVITVNVWLGVPFMLVALLGGLQSIDKDLMDAAAVDGAGPWRRFWDVTMPGLRPVAATVVLLGLIWTFNMFNVIFLMTGGGPGTDTQILVTYAYREAFDNRFFGSASAYGVIVLSMLMLFSLFYRRMMRRLGEETWT